MPDDADIIPVGMSLAAARVLSQHVSLLKGDVHDVRDDAMAHVVVLGETVQEVTASMFSGHYADLEGKPTLFDGHYSSLTGKPTLFAPAPHSHSFSDLTGVPVRTFNFAPGRALVIAANAANGFKVSDTRDTLVSYGVTITIPATAPNASSAQVVLEMCPTNSAAPTNWKPAGRVAFSTPDKVKAAQSMSGMVTGMVPAGWFCRLRSTVSGAGVSTTLSDQQEVIM